MASIDDVLAVAKPVERVVHVCVAGHISGEYEDKVFELSQAQETNSGRLGGQVDTTELELRVEELSEEMAKHTFEFKLQGMSSLRWSNLLSEHPDPDGKLIFNEKTFPQAAIAKCVTEPEGFDDPAKVEKLLDVLSPAQFDDLFTAVWEIHQTAPKGLNF